MIGNLRARFPVEVRRKSGPLEENDDENVHKKLFPCGGGDMDRCRWMDIHRDIVTWLQEINITSAGGWSFRVG